MSINSKPIASALSEKVARERQELLQITHVSLQTLIIPHAIGSKLIDRGGHANQNTRARSKSYIRLQCLARYCHKHDKAKKPLCIFNNGSDGSILDWWTMGGEGMFERGYNLVTFDGPGQGSSLFEKNLYFRHDWEKVITPVVDSVINRKDVDKNNIVLYGISQAGYWVPRAAAFEKRIKAVVIDPGVVKVNTSWVANIPEQLVALYKAGNKDLFNKYLGEALKQNAVAASVYNFRARPYGFDNPYNTYKAVEKYDLEGVADKITCNVIITSPDDESFWPGQSHQLYDMIKAPKQLITFTKAEGGNFHCEPKARVLWEQKVLDKLDAIMKI